jgi:hypothetical protein
MCLAQRQHQTAPKACYAQSDFRDHFNLLFRKKSTDDFTKIHRDADCPQRRGAIETRVDLL